MNLKEITHDFVGRIVCSHKEYLAAHAVGSSSLRTIIDQSPAHYWYNLRNPPEPTPAQAFGTAIHQAILEPVQFKKLAIVEPVFSGTGSRSAREIWHLENHGKTILKQDQFDTIQGILDKILEHKQASRLIAEGAAESSFFWKDAETGITCKARPDFLRDDHIVADVKSCLDASYFAFNKALVKYNYAVQAALYLDGISAVLDKQFDTFVIIAVESSPPYAVQCFQLDNYSIQEGRSIYQRALKILKQCQESGKYPAYSEELTPIALPSWAVRSEL